MLKLEEEEPVICPWKAVEGRSSANDHLRKSRYFPE